MARIAECHSVEHKLFPESKPQIKVEDAQIMIIIAQ